MAAVVLPLPGPVFTMISPRRISDILGELLIVPVLADYSGEEHPDRSWGFRAQALASSDFRAGIDLPYGISMTWRKFMPSSVWLLSPSKWTVMRNASTS